jgi:hypothetical protein
MIVYEASKKGFIDDVVSNTIDKKILDIFSLKTGHQVAKSEREAWRNSMRYMRDVLFDKQIPIDAGVLVEFHLFYQMKIKM